MLKKISNTWWMLNYEGAEGKYVWFGYTEGEVKQKFAAWMDKVSMHKLINPTRVTGAPSETAYGYGSRA